MEIISTELADLSSINLRLSAQVWRKKNGSGNTMRQEGNEEKREIRMEWNENMGNISLPILSSHDRIECLKNPRTNSHDWLYRNSWAWMQCGRCAWIVPELCWVGRQVDKDVTNSRVVPSTNQKSSLSERCTTSTQTTHATCQSVNRTETSLHGAAIVSNSIPFRVIDATLFHVSCFYNFLCAQHTLFREVILATKPIW